MTYVDGSLPNAAFLAGEARHETQPFYLQRPGWLNAQIDTNFEREHAVPVQSRIFANFNGTDMSYAIAGHDTGDVADRLCGERGGPISFLDVGTGAGYTVLHRLQEGDYAQGITALNYYQLNERHPFHDSPHYLVADAERLAVVPGLLPQYDLVVSRASLHHFVDPLGALAQMAEKVSPGGYLCVDEFGVANTQADGQVTADTVVAWMRAGGFEPVAMGSSEPAEDTSHTVPDVIWRRVGDPAALAQPPFEYDYQSGGLAYTLSH